MNSFKEKLYRLLVAVVVGPLAAGLAFGAEPETPGSSARKSPDWLRSAVVYEIFPRNFSAAGDFNGITARLDELKDLGVDILWLLPIHPIGEQLKKGSIGSPFAVRDFYALNPAYGSTNDFKRLIAESHRRGLKVIMDIVAGQTSWDSVLMQRPGFYLKDTNGVIIPPDPGWTDVAGLNHANPEVRRYMIDMMKYWLRDFGVDGFRCEVAPTVPVEFWEAARVELEQINPQVVIFADAGAKPALLAKAFDVDSSWNLFHTVDKVMSSVSPAYLIKQSLANTEQQFPRNALHLRISDNHEQPRAVARFGVHGALAVQVLMLMLDGVPLFYNGMEVGDATESADPALFEKMPVFWNPGGRPPLREIYRDLIQLRKEHPVFYNSQVQWVENTAAGEVVSILRRDAKEEFLILINLSSQRVTGSVELPGAEGFEAVKISGGLAEPVGVRIPDFRLSGFGWFIYRRAIAK